ncbi:MAG: M56 family metallopeptidase, partial [Brevundimonas sp.]
MIATLFLTLLVKSGLIAMAGLAASRIPGLRVTDRVDILRATTVLLLALPVIMALLPSLDLALLPVRPADPAPLPMWTGEMVSVGGVAVSGAMPWPSPSLLLLAAWAVGVAALALRLALGLHTLGRWTETGQTVASADWSRPLQRLAPRRAPRLISTDRIDGPLSWGTTPGVILIDHASLSAPETAPAVLAHELGHLRRHDWVFLMLSRLAVALFWFNPLVWRLQSELAARSEETADAEALRTVDRQTYARTLIRLAAQPSPHVATAMAADARSLKTRIACIMSDLPPSRRRPVTVALTLAGLAAVATPLAALELHNRAAPAAAPAIATAAA